MDAQRVAAGRRGLAGIETVLLRAHGLADAQSFALSAWKMPTRLSSRIRSSSRIECWPDCASDWPAMRSISASSRSGTSISLVQGHFSAGPNWPRKCRIPASPPAMR